MGRTVNIRALTQFPARVLAGTGARIVKANGVWTFSLDLSQLNTLASIPVADQDNIFLLSYNSAGSPTHSLISAEVLLNAVNAGLDATLVAIGGLAPAANQMIYFTGADTAALATITSQGRDLLDDATAGDQLNTLGISAFAQTILDDTDATTARATLGLVIGTNVQAFDAELAAIAGLTSAADKVPYFTGAGTAAVADFTSAGRSMAGAANAAAQTVLLSAFTGDSGAGGVKGLVPAPAAGDAASNKFLKADGTWTAGASGIGGSTGATDNRVLRADGVGGSTAQSSAVTIDDSGNVTGVAGLTASGAVSGATVAGAMVADQTAMEAASATNLIVTPGRAHFHPGVAKAWGSVTYSAGTPTLNTNYNLTSITDGGVGVITFTIANDFSSADWSASAQSSGAFYVNIQASTRAAGSATFQVRNDTGVLTDPTNEFSFVGFGDL